MLRTYRLSTPAIIFCNNQTAAEWDNFTGDAHLARRESAGGGHMYFSEDDILFSFIAPKSFYDSTDLHDNYRQANSYMIDALKSMGIQAHAGKTSIRLGDKLIAGASRIHKKNAYLHQASLMLDEYNDEIFRHLNAGEDEIERWNQAVLPLKRLGYSSGKILSSIYKHLESHGTSELKEEEMQRAQGYLDKFQEFELKPEGPKESICLITLSKSKDKDKYL